MVSIKFVTLPQIWGRYHSVAGLILSGAPIIPAASKPMGREEKSRLLPASLDTGGIDAYLIITRPVLVLPPPLADLSFGRSPFGQNCLLRCAWVAKLTFKGQRRGARRGGNWSGVEELSGAGRRPRFKGGRHEKIDLMVAGIGGVFGTHPAQFLIGLHRRPEGADRKILHANRLGGARYGNRGQGNLEELAGAV